MSPGVAVPPVPLGLRLVWDDIANAPVADPASVDDWNAFFLGSFNTSVEVNGNTVTLFGSPFFQFSGGGGSPLQNNTHIVEIHDDGGVVKSLGANVSFLNCSGLTTIDFPFIDINEGVELSEVIFQDCHALVSVNLPTVKIVPNLAFFNCFALATIDLPAATSLQAAFVGCNSLVSVNIPNVEIIIDQCFEGCTALETISAPKCTACTNGGNFISCENLKTVNLPLCEALAPFDFLACHSLETLYLPVCTDMGGSPGDDTVFFDVAGLNITLTIPAATAADADVQTLQANNTVTLILT